MLNRKVIRNISIDLDLDDKLRAESNASSLINEMLRKHFESQDMTKWSKAQLKAFIAEQELLQKHAKELEALHNGQD